MSETVFITTVITRADTFWRKKEHRACFHSILHISISKRDTMAQLNEQLSIVSLCSFVDGLGQAVRW